MKAVVAFVCTLICFSCYTGQSAGVQDSPRQPYAQYRTLADALRKHGGLLVTGTGFDQKVLVRRSVNQSQDEPLYVLNGFPLGNSYVRANQAINMAEVESIRVLQSLTQTATYGSMGSAGVIEISTTVQPSVETSPSRVRIGRE